ncbi:MAG: hypothetical protein HYY18_12825 [Planctomycetes bacterium]|nr:hypothetical protein [Planctomycetota bacterium]
MSRREAMLAAVLLAAVVAALLLARKRGEERAEARASGVARQAGPPSESPAPRAAGGNPGDDPLGTKPEPRRRGLWRLEPEEAARLGASNLPHPWTDYLDLREEVFAAWAGKRLELDLKDTPFTDLPAILGAATGLVLRIDPGVLGDGPATLRGSFTAVEALRAIARARYVRFTVGTDGIACLAPLDSPAETEPAFAAELMVWDRAVWRRETEAPDPEEEKEAAAVRKRLQDPEKHGVEIVRQPLRAALWKISEIYGVEFDYPHIRSDRGPLWEEEVTFVSEGATLREALKAILTPHRYAFRVSSYGLELTITDEIRDDPEIEDWAETELKRRRAGIAKVREVRVRLDGCPLAAGDIVAECARQGGFPCRLDPRLGASPTRWKAVEAEMALGAVLDEAAAGTGGAWELRRAGWPEAGEYESAGWVLWFYATPSPTK